MFDDTRLLVVDDEDTICRGCERILSVAGFRVETSCDACAGLSLAVEKDYAAILLDLRMPQMDGIQFLARLRKRKPEVPVIILTGYPSIPDAASAMRLGAADYVTKPFTPARITHAVRRVLPADEPGATKQPGPGSPGEWSAVPAPPGFRHYDEAWLRPVDGGLVRLGAMVPRSGGGTVEAVWPPKAGWFVHQGLPLAVTTLTGHRHLTVPSPISGVVIDSNALLLEHPSVLWDDPYGEGWIACVRPDRFEEEADRCKSRTVIVASADERAAREQRGLLMSLGCQVSIAAALGEVGPTLLQNPDCRLLIVDAASLGERGPELAARISAAASPTKILVVASPGREWESAYRERGISHYVVEPFANAEILGALDAAFRFEPLPARQEEGPGKVPSAFLNRISITNPGGQKVGLVSEGGLLRRNAGLGRQLARELENQFPCVETTLGSTFISAAIREASSACDHVLILLARDTGRLPGTLRREGFTPSSAEKAGKVTTLLVQPASCCGPPLEFDTRTTAALAQHITREMALC